MHELHLYKGAKKEAAVEGALAGTWHIDMDIIGNPIVGDAVITKDGENYAFSFAGASVVLIPKEDGTYRSLPDNEAAIEVVVEPLDATRAIVSIKSTQYNVGSTSEMTKID